MGNCECTNYTLIVYACFQATPPILSIGSDCSGSGQCPAPTTCSLPKSICTCSSGVLVNGNTECKTNALAVKKKCSVASLSDGCEGNLFCQLCANATFPICSEKATASTMPVPTVSIVKPHNTTLPFGLGSEASRSAFGVGTAMFAVLAFVM